MSYDKKKAEEFNHRFRFGFSIFMLYSLTFFPKMHMFEVTSGVSWRLRLFPNKWFLSCFVYSVFP